MESKRAEQTRRQRLGYVLGFIGVLIFSGTLPATRLAIADFEPGFLTFGRAAVATIAAAIVLAALRRPFPVRHAWMIFISGLLLVFGFPGFMALAMTSVPASHGGVVLGILPLTTAIFATVLAGERPAFWFWLCSIIGSALIIVFAFRDGAPGFEVGDLWLLAAGLTASLGYVLAARVTFHMPGWEVVSWSLILTAPISIIATVALWQPSYLTPSSTGAAAFAYVGLGSMFLGFFAWNAGLMLGGMARVGQLQLLQTFFTLAISAIILGETITGEMVFFAALVLAVVLIGQRAKVQR